MVNNVLILSEDFVKTNSNLSDNAWGKFLLPAIRESQDIYLQTILGKQLYTTILNKIKDGTLDEQYKELTDDYIRWYLLYMVLSDIIDILDVKMANLGNYRSSDQYIENISDGERQRLKQNYAYKAQFYGDRLVEYLLENKQAFPELDECTCEGLNSHLNNQASTGIFLGGIRGRNVRTVR